MLLSCIVFVNCRNFVISDVRQRHTDAESYITDTATKATVFKKSCTVLCIYCPTTLQFKKAKRFTKTIFTRSHILMIKYAISISVWNPWRKPSRLHELPTLSQTPNWLGSFPSALPFDVSSMTHATFLNVLTFSGHFVRFHCVYIREYCLKELYSWSKSYSQCGLCV